MSIQDFQILAKLGQGAYSSVYKVKRLVDQAIYALKKVKLVNLSPRQIHNAVNQVRILASIRHPNIIGYKQAFYDTASKSLCIVMQFADGGDLLQKIFKNKKTNTLFDEQYIWDIFLQIVKGLKALHDLKILHRDIKSANVFLMKNGTAKLGDMNVSKVLRKQTMCETQTGTPYYASPEVWHDQPYDAKSDIWSLGCVLYEFITLKPPFRAKDMEGLYKKVTRGFYSRIHKNYSEDLSNLLKMVIKTKPSDRLSCDQLLQCGPVKRRGRKQKQIQLEQKSVLLKTIKLSKNINYLTQKLPKPNYSPLRFKIGNRSSVDNRYRSPQQLHTSLPPIKSERKGQISTQNAQRQKQRSILKKKLKISLKSQQEESKIIRSNASSLPKLSIKKYEVPRKYLY